MHLRRPLQCVPYDQVHLLADIDESVLHAILARIWTFISGGARLAIHTLPNCPYRKNQCGNQHGCGYPLRSMQKGLTINVFTLDETAFSRELAPLAGLYLALELGPPWWFFDSYEGMLRFRETTTETCGHYNTAGLNDVTRTFLFDSSKTRR